MSFEGSRPSFRRGKLDRMWIHASASTEFSDPRVLWKEFWPKYNRVTLPLLDQNAFFADATSLARIARNRKEIEALLKERRDERIEELRDVLLEVGQAFRFHAHSMTPQPPRARTAINKMLVSRTLDSYIQFIAGTIFGWPEEDLIPPIQRPERKTPSDPCRRHDSESPLPLAGQTPSPYPSTPSVAASFDDGDSQVDIESLQQELLSADFTEDVGLPRPPSSSEKQTLSKSPPPTIDVETKDILAGQKRYGSSSTPHYSPKGDSSLDNHIQTPHRHLKRSRDGDLDGPVPKRHCHQQHPPVAKQEKNDDRFHRQANRARRANSEPCIAFSNTEM